MVRSTAGAAIAPRPEVTMRRREILRSVMASSCCAISIVLRACVFEVLQHFRAQRGLLRRAPLAKSFARLEAEPLVRDQFLKIRRRTGPRFDVGQHGLVDGEREVS